MITVDLPPVMCPNCQYTVECATAISEGENVKPKEGDWSICINCGQFLVFQHDLTLGVPTPAQTVGVSIKYGKEFSKLQLAQKMIQKRGPLTERTALPSTSTWTQTGGNA